MVQARGSISLYPAEYKHRNHCSGNGSPTNMLKAQLSKVMPVKLHV